MRLHELIVENWRGIKLQTVHFHPRLTIVQGPNESGKSTLRDALRMVLLEKYSSTKAKGAQPWTTSVYPRAQLAFDVGAQQYSVSKSFLKRKDAAELYRNGKLIAQDAQVQVELEHLLGDEAQWLHTLWGTQGTVDLSQAVPQTMRGRLAAASQETVSPGVAWLAGRLEEAYKEYWTDKRGDPNSHLKKIRLETIEAETRLAEAKAALADADRREAALADDVRQVDEWRGQVAAVEKAIAEAEGHLKLWDAWRQASQSLKAKRDQHDQVKRWLSSWQQEMTRLTEAQDAARSYSARLATAQPGEAPSRQAVTDLRTLETYLKLSIDLDHVQALERLPAVDRNDVARLRTLENDLRAIEAGLSAGLMTVGFDPERRFEVEADVDGEVSNTVVETAEEWTAAASFRLSIPGVGKVTVQGGNAGAQDLLVRRTATQKELAALLKKTKVKSADEAQTLLQQRATVEGQLGGRRPDRDEWERLRGEISNLADLDPVDKQARLALLPKEIAAAEKAWTEADKIYRQISDRYTKLLQDDPRQKVNACVNSLKSLLSSAPAVEGAPAWSEDPLPDVTPWVDAERSLAEEIRGLEPTVVRPEGTEVSTAWLDHQRHQLDDLRQRVQAREQAVQQAIGGLRTQGDLFAREVAAEEALARAQEAQRLVDAQAFAVKLLQQTFLDAREKLQREVAAPLESRVAERLERLTQDRYKAVQFDRDMRVATVVPQAVATAAAVTDLSFGTQEQLMLLTRLCLAELLAENQTPQVVILDDNLVHTDSARMEMACRMLAAASEKVQVVVFTCHPERYDFGSVEHAVHDLGAGALVG